MANYKQIGGSSSKLYQHNIRFNLGSWPAGSYMCNVRFIVINSNSTPIEEGFDSFVKFLTSDYFIPCCGMATNYNIKFPEGTIRYLSSYLINGIRAKSTVPNAIYLSGVDMAAGIGIDEKDYEKIFTKFSRIDNPLTRKVQGSGLGLFITKNLVEKMDGKISVSSKNNITTFEVQLPSANIEKQARAKCKR